MKQRNKAVCWAETEPLLRKVVLAGFVLLTLWLAAIVLAPLFVSAQSTALNMLGSAIYFFMDPVCHQLPARSLFENGLPMPVCARCFAIYLSGMVVVGFAIVKKAFYLWPARWYVFLTIAAASMIVPEKVGWMDDYLEVRLLAGALLGVLIFRLLLEAVVYGKRNVNG